MVEQVNNYLDLKAQPLFKEYQCSGSITTALIIRIRKPLSVKSLSRKKLRRRRAVDLNERRYGRVINAVGGPIPFLLQGMVFSCAHRLIETAKLFCRIYVVALELLDFL